MRVLISFRTWLVICMVMIPALTLAIIPPSVTDRDLSQSPIIVIGYWPKAKFVSRNNVKGNVCYDLESTTKLIITKVIRGRLAVGSHTLLLKDWISWSKDGTMLNSASSSEMLGDVDDVSKPNIWFLTISKSWKKSDKTEYLHAFSYRCAQPRNLLAFYQTLAMPRRDSEVSKHLLSSDPIVVERSLEFVSDNFPAWPQNPDRQRYTELYGISYEPNPLAKLHRVTQQLPTLLKIIHDSKRPCRPTALGLYAEMVGTPAISELQRALKDRDANVRCTAAAWLVRFGQVKDHLGLHRAVRGYTDFDLGIELLYAMKKSGSMEYVPILIEHLQPVMTPKPDHRDWKELALESRTALKSITGFTFPLDAALSSRAWAQANSKPKDQMLQTLLGALGDWENPIEITATFVRKLDRKKKSQYDFFSYYLVHLKIKNMTSHPIKLSSIPDGFTLSGRFGSASGGVGGKAQRVITIDPGGTFETDVELFEAIKGARLEFSYRNAKNGAWIGDVSTTLR